MTVFKDTLCHHTKNMGESRKENTAFFRATAVGGYLEDRSNLWGLGGGKQSEFQEDVCVLFLNRTLCLSFREWIRGLSLLV